jgi:hypothetical protein
MASEVARLNKQLNKCLIKSRQLKTKSKILDKKWALKTASKITILTYISFHVSKAFNYFKMYFANTVSTVGTVATTTSTSVIAGTAGVALSGVTGIVIYQADVNKTKTPVVLSKVEYRQDENIVVTKKNLKTDKLNRRNYIKRDGIENILQKNKTIKFVNGTSISGDIIKMESGKFFIKDKKGKLCIISEKLVWSIH